MHGILSFSVWNCNLLMKWEISFITKVMKMCNMKNTIVRAAIVFGANAHAG